MLLQLLQLDIHLHMRAGKEKDEKLCCCCLLARPPALMPTKDKPDMA
jgi:hypothetical protein